MQNTTIRSRAKYIGSQSLLEGQIPTNIGGSMNHDVDFLEPFQSLTREAKIASRAVAIKDKERFGVIDWAASVRVGDKAMQIFRQALRRATNNPKDTLGCEGRSKQSVEQGSA